VGGKRKRQKKKKERLTYLYLGGEEKGKRSPYGEGRGKREIGRKKVERKVARRSLKRK